MQRQTSQRTAICAVIEGADRPLAPAEILDLARKTVPTLGIATVYRAIKALTNDGWLEAVELPGDTTRYERAGKHHHHHFHCRNCDGVYEIDGCPGPLERLAPSGFVLESHELVLYGVCAGCAA